MIILPEGEVTEGMVLSCQQVDELAKTIKYLRKSLQEADKRNLELSEKINQIKGCMCGGNNND